MKETKICDVWDALIIGGGAAGLMSAVQIRRLGHRVLVLDGKSKIGAKILMSGGTRCNLTNADVRESDFSTGEPRVLRSVLRGFTSRRAVEYFREIGIEVVSEEGGKYFPSTHSGRTVLEAFLAELSRLGIALETGCKAESIEPAGQGWFKVRTSGGKEFVSRTVVLATGGLSYPGSGSDGSGYGLARAFGHSIVETTPSLTPLTGSDPDWKTLSGVSLPVRLTLKISGKKKISFEGPLLFTHTGYSGPAVLNISRYWLREKGERVLTANFLPSSHEEAARKYLLDMIRSHPEKKAVTVFSHWFPARFSDVYLKKMGAGQGVLLSQMPKALRDAALKNIFAYPLPVSGTLGYEKAEVTAGGISLDEVDRLTLESKKQPGLFFCGEILDADGRIGGFNFQWAWSSGAAAARGVDRFLKSLKP